MSGGKQYIGALIIAIAGALFWIMPAAFYNKIVSLKEAVAERETITRERRDILEKIQELNRLYNDRSSDINKLSLVVPKSKDAAEILSSVQDMASRSGLQLISSSISSGNSEPDSSFELVTIELGLLGNYPSLIIFLDSLEKNTRLIDVVSMNINPLSEGTILSFRLTAQAYYLK